MKPADIVSAERTGAPRPKLVTVTVEQTMRQLRARCVRGKLVDGKGKEIRFYRMQCFGAPTEYAMETTRRQRVELESPDHSLEGPRIQDFVLMLARNERPHP